MSTSCHPGRQQRRKMQLLGLGRTAFLPRAATALPSLSLAVPLPLSPLMLLALARILLPPLFLSFSVTPLGYTHESGLGRAPAFSMSGRTETRSESVAPGPGAYDYSQSLSRSSAPAFSLSGRHETKLDSSAPGPGAYDSTTPARGRAFSMGSRNPQKMENFVRKFLGLGMLMLRC